MRTFPVVRTAASAVLPPSTDGANKRGERSNAALVGTCKADNIQSRRRLRKAADTQAERQRVVEGSQIVKIQKNSRHPIPQAEQLFKPKSRNAGVEGGLPSPFSGGFKGGILFGKRIPPLSSVPLRSAGKPHRFTAQRSVHPLRMHPVPHSARRTARQIPPRKGPVFPAPLLFSSSTSLTRRRC